GATRSRSVKPAILSNQDLMRAWRRTPASGANVTRRRGAICGRKHDLAEIDELALLLSLNGRTLAKSAIEAHRREEAPCAGWKPTAQPSPTLERERVRRSRGCTARKPTTRCLRRSPPGLKSGPPSSLTTTVILKVRAILGSPTRSRMWVTMLRR